MKKNKTNWLDRADKTRCIVSLVCYIGHDPQDKEYLNAIKKLAVESGKTLTNYVLDAIESYARSNHTKPTITPEMPVSAPLKPIAIQPQTPEIDYSELEDPPAPRVDASRIPDSRPK